LLKRVKAMLNMLDKSARTNSFACAAMVGAVGLTLLLGGMSSSAFAQEGGYGSVIGSVLRGIGLRGPENSIDYRERAPLVVPPGRELPPPRDPNTLANTPSWPVDPDAKRRSEEAAARATEFRIYDEREEGRALRPDELNRGPVRTSGRSVASQSPEEGARPLRPSELGTTRNIWNSIWSSVTPQQPESAPFKGEPPRARLTEPPRGYQTPSSNQPYGVGTPKNESKAEDFYTTHGTKQY
jgi:hypothetical protein